MANFDFFFKDGKEYFELTDETFGEIKCSGPLGTGMGYFTTTGKKEFNRIYESFNKRFKDQNITNHELRNEISSIYELIGSYNENQISAYFLLPMIADMINALNMRQEGLPCYFKFGWSKIKAKADILSEYANDTSRRHVISMNLSVIIDRTNDDGIKRYYLEKNSDFFDLYVYLLKEYGATFQKCSAPDCNIVFVKYGKRTYCSHKCAEEANRINALSNISINKYANIVYKQLVARYERGRMSQKKWNRAKSTLKYLKKRAIEQNEIIKFASFTFPYLKKRSELANFEEYCELLRH